MPTPEHHKKTVAPPTPISAAETVAMRTDESAIFSAAQLRPTARLNPDASVFEAARLKMTELLCSLKFDITPAGVLADQALGIAVLPHSNQIIASGRTSLVIGLGMVAGDRGALPMAAKIVGYAPDPERPSRYFLEGRSAGGQPGALEETVACLRRLGFENAAEHREYPFIEESVRLHGMEASIYPKYFHLCTDLRGDGRFSVGDACTFDFSRIPNGLSLAQEYHDTLGRLQKALAVGSCRLTITDKHALGTPEEALAHMLLVCVERTNRRGHLVFGDLDHCRLSLS